MKSITIILIFFSLGAFGAKRPVRTWEKEDKMAISITNKESATLNDLVKKIRSFHTDNWGRFRVAFRWVAEHIVYDVVSYKTNKIKAQSAEETLKKRKAICSGYAELLKAIAIGIGINSEVITGFAKWDGICYEKYSEANHAWNAAEIDGSWYLFDATWAAGNVDEKIDRFRKDFDDFYFAPAPEELLFNHLPLNSKWQLVADTLTRAAFESRCSVRVTLFQLGLTVESVKKMCPTSKCELVEFNYHFHNKISKAEIPFERVLTSGTAYSFTIQALDAVQYYIENTPPAPTTITPANDEKVIQRTAIWTSAIDPEKKARQKTAISLKKNRSQITVTPLPGYLGIFRTENGKSEIVFKWTVQ